MVRLVRLQLCRQSFLLARNLGKTALLLVQALVITLLGLYIFSNKAGELVIDGYSVLGGEKSPRSVSRELGQSLALGDVETPGLIPGELWNLSSLHDNITTIQQPMKNDNDDKNTTKHERCGNGTTGKNGTTCQLPTCPSVSPKLKGRLYPSFWLHFPPWSEIVQEVGADVRLGGRYNPPACQARLRVAVVIPFRDRELHLRTLMRHLHPVLQRQQLEYRIFVVEQNMPVVFNKASMMNVGYLEVGKLWPEYDCMVFHDVDMIMENDNNVFRCGDKPHHMGVYTDKFGYRLIYYGMFGGVVSFTKDQFYLVNGYSNNYFGWGGEDDDMFNRIKAKELDISRPPPEVARYIQLKHDRDQGNPVNKHRVSRNGAYTLSPEKYKVDGVKQIRYDVLEIKDYPLFTWIHVDLDTSNLNFTMDMKRVYHNYTKKAGKTCKGDDLEAYMVSLVTCRFYCDRRLTCTGFVYTAIMEQPCYLKSSICKQPIEEKSDLYIKEINSASGAALKHVYTEFDGDCLGGDIDSFLISPDECARRCDTAEECVAFQYSDSLYRPCWLKKKCENKDAKAGLKLYIKGDLRTS